MHLEDWLDDLCVRFIINLPRDDLESVERICFHIEEAQWYYEDFIRPLDPSLPSMSLRTFSLRLFQHCPLLAPLSHNNQSMSAFEHFLLYKKKIPVRGAILLNQDMDSVILVKGWKKSANWSFPRGKINKDEDDLICAIREVYEETGYDLESSGLIPASRDVKSISLQMSGQDMQLFVVRDVPMDTYFEPRTRKEISKIQWWRISDLPGFKKKKGQGQQDEIAINANKFYMVAPFLKDLRKWIIEQKKIDNNKRVSSAQYLSAGLSHDELLTEEDGGAESAREQVEDGPSSTELEGATTVLKNLLKMQPPTEGLQMDTVKSPHTRDNGSELLALLQGTRNVPQQVELPVSLPPQAPLDYSSDQTYMPATPHHHHPRPQHFSSLPHPPAFNIQHQPEAFSYQLPNQNQHHNGSQPIYQRVPIQHQQPQAQYNNNRSNYQHSQQYVQNQHQLPPQNIRPQHTYQSQHLVHPQPLPPHVQRAVFNGGPVHVQAMPDTTQQNGPQNDLHISHVNNGLQFPNAYASAASQGRKPQPPQLTNHSQTLLNSFKKSSATVEEPATRDLPLREFGHNNQRSAPQDPQELPTEVSRTVTVDLLSMFPATGSAAQTPTASLHAKKPISDAQKSNLLNLFKSPKLETFDIQPTATALPTSSTPSAVELSAVEPHSSNSLPLSSLADGERSISKNKHYSEQPKINPEASLPFRATAILARPAQASEHSHPVRNSPIPKAQHNGQNGKRHAGTPTKGRTKRSTEKPFQPQILKRQQPITEAQPAPTVSPLVHAVQSHPSNAHFAPSPSHAPEAVVYNQATVPASPLSFTQPSLQTATQKSNLLSLFGSAQAPTSGSRNVTLVNNAQSPDHTRSLLSLLGRAVTPNSAPNPPAHRQELSAHFNKAPEPILTSPRIANAHVPPSGAHTQTLLSMFSSAPQNFKPQPKLSLDDISPMQPGSAARSRVGSLIAEGTPPPRTGPAPMSPADKNFLLSYLDSVGKGAAR